MIKQILQATTMTDISHGKIKKQESKRYVKSEITILVLQTPKSETNIFWVFFCKANAER